MVTSVYPMLHAQPITTETIFQLATFTVPNSRTPKGFIHLESLQCECYKDGLMINAFKHQVQPTVIISINFLTEVKPNPVEIYQKNKEAICDFLNRVKEKTNQEIIITGYKEAGQLAEIILLDQSIRQLKSVTFDSQADKKKDFKKSYSTKMIRYVLDHDPTRYGDQGQISLVKEQAFDQDLYQRFTLATEKINNMKQKEMVERRDQQDRWQRCFSNGSFIELKVIHEVPLFENSKQKPVQDFFKNKQNILNEKKTNGIKRERNI